MLAWRGCIINCLHYMACNLYYISTARRYITIPFCNGQMHILALWILNSMTPFWCLNYYFQVFTTPIRHTKEFNPSPSASLGYWNWSSLYTSCAVTNTGSEIFFSPRPASLRVAHSWESGMTSSSVRERHMKVWVHVGIFFFWSLTARLACFFACQCCCWRNMPSVSFLDIILCTLLYCTCILVS